MTTAPAYPDLVRLLEPKACCADPDHLLAVRLLDRVSRKIHEVPGYPCALRFNFLRVLQQLDVIINIVPWPMQREGAMGWSTEGHWSDPQVRRLLLDINSTPEARRLAMFRWWGTSPAAEYVLFTPDSLPEQWRQCAGEEAWARWEAIQLRISLAGLPKTAPQSPHVGRKRL